MNLKDYIQEIPDFPKPGILFRDISPILAEPRVFKQCTSLLAAKAGALNPSLLVGIESRGFIFGAPLAQTLGLPFVLLRKAGKLPGQTTAIEYELEYGRSKLEIKTESIKPGSKVLIIDDLLATGGTAQAASKLIENLGGQVVGLLFLIELSQLNGRKILEPHSVQSLVNYE